jgi:hypothetical protein
MDFDSHVKATIMVVTWARCTLVRTSTTINTLMKIMLKGDTIYFMKHINQNIMYKNIRSHKFMLHFWLVVLMMLSILHVLTH